jgi:transcriptional regulator with XRE-family HTH domain
MKTQISGEYIAAQQEQLDRNLTRVVEAALKQKHWSRNRLAVESGIAQSTLSNIMSEKDSGRSWNFHLLFRVAAALQVDLPTLITAACSGEEVASLSLKLAGTEPGSAERLQILVYEAVDFIPDGNNDLVGTLYRVKDIEYAVPDFWAGYSSGAISDESALFLLNKAAERHLTAGEDAPPFWAALLMEWKESLASGE